MTDKQVLTLRLHNQQLLKPAFATAAEVVEWMGAVQAQDYYGALWSVGQRTNVATSEVDIEKDIFDKKIVRSWPMRGTLHFVNPNDLRWMLKYLAVKVRPRMNSVFKKAGL